MASPVIQNLFANLYRDDFSDSDNYHRILFNGGRAVQARELTQLQTIIQREMERFGNNVFKDGGSVNPVQNVLVDNNYAFVKLSVDTTTLSTSLVGLVFVGATSSVKAKVLEVIDAEGSDPATLYVQYIYGSGLTGYSTFLPGETINQDGGGETFNVQSTNTTEDPAVGHGTSVSVGSGDFFTQGHFIFIEAQDVILSKYSKNASGVVGFKITESIVTEDDDSKLYDNSSANPNFSAPGAHRYKISGTLVDQVTINSDETFIYVARIVDGEVKNINNGKDDYNRILDLLAERTREESGNYVVTPFVSHFETDSDAGYLNLNIGDGIAYVDGYRTAPGAQKLRIPKPVNTSILNNEAISAVYGNYILVNNMLGVYDVTSLETLNLRDNATYASGNTIGSARIRAIEEDGSNYKLYLFDVKMHTGKSFRNVRSIGTSSTRNAQLILENGIAVIKEQNNNNLFFPLPRSRPSSISSVDYTYSVMRYALKTVTTNTITLTKGTGESFDDTVLWVFADTGAGGAILTPTNINPTTGVVTFSAATGPVAAFYIVQKGGAGSPVPYKTKTLTETTVSAALVTDSDGTYVPLGKADVFEVVSVKSVDSDGASLSSRFYLDNGQRDNYYGLGKMKLAPGNTNPGVNVFVRFKYFAHGGAGDFFCVDSYDTINDVTYATIPSYRQKDGTRIELRDVLDFRPTINTAGTGFTGAGSSASELPRNTDLVTLDIEYYLPRKDRLTIQSDGGVRYLPGVSDFDPKLPEVPGNSLELYNFALNPNTLDEKDLLANYVDNRRYTMRDIAKLHKKINKVEELATLSLLDIAASSLEVLDSAGLPRTKAGFLTDDFKDHRAANVDDLEYRASIDPTAGILRPAFREKNVTLYFDSDNVATTGTILVGDQVMLDYTDTLWIEQLQASRRQNVNPYTVINYQGRLVLSPSSDESRDTSNIRLRTNGRNEIGIETFLNNVLGTNDTQNVLRTIANNPEFGGRSEFIRNSISLENANNFTTAGSLADALETLPPNVSQILGSVFDRIEPTWREYQWGWAGIDSRKTEEELASGGVGATNRNTFGRFATRLFVPRIRSREVRFRATGLLPNTRHYPFFDGTRVDDYCLQPSRIGVNFGGQNWRWGRRVDTWNWTDYNGRIYRRHRDWTWHPHWGSTAPTTSQKALIADDNGIIEGSFFIPNDKNLQFFAGNREFALYDITTQDDRNSTSRAWTNYTVEGTNLVRFQRIRPPARPVRTTGGGGQNLGLFLALVAAILIFDPIAQSFKVDNEEGVFVTKIGVYFASKSSFGIPVDCEIRPLVNGYPSSDEIVAGAFAQLTPAEVSTSSNASAITYFQFDAPVYLEGGKEYAFVLRAATTEYDVWISRIGDFVLGRTDKKITKQPAIGSFFKSQNGSTWEATQTDDIKFQIYRADFVSSGVAILNNAGYEPKLLVPNPFLFDSGDATVRVLHPNHGLQVNDIVQFFGLDSSATYPMSVNSIFGPRTITAVDGTGYVFEADQVATGTIRSGGAGIYVADNVLMDEIYPSIEVETPPTTNLSLKGKFSYGASLAGDETAYGTEATFAHNLSPFEAYKFDYPRIIVSEQLEGTGGYPTVSAAIQASLTTDNSWVSPVVSAERCSITAINNLIDNQDSAATVGYNVPLSFIAETDPIGGTSLAKYVTKPVTIEEAAVGLKVILSANKPSSSNWQVYYKAITAEDSLNTTNWVLAEPDSPLKSDENPSIFREYRYTIGGFGSPSGGDLSPFTTFQIKIVMNSTNSSKVPVFRDLRAIALVV